MSFILEKLPGDVLRCRKMYFSKNSECAHYPHVYMKRSFNHGMSYMYMEQI